MTVLKNNKKIPVWDYDKKNTYNCPHCKSLIEYGVQDIKQRECYSWSDLWKDQPQPTQIYYIQCPVCGYKKDLIELEAKEFIKQWRNMTDEEAFPNETDEQREYRQQRIKQEQTDIEDEQNRVVIGVAVIVCFVLLVVMMCCIQAFGK